MMVGWNTLLKWFWRNTLFEVRQCFANPITRKFTSTHSGFAASIDRCENILKCRHFFKTENRLQREWEKKRCMEHQLLIGLFWCCHIFWGTKIACSLKHGKRFILESYKSCTAETAAAAVLRWMKCLSSIQTKRVWENKEESLITNSRILNIVAAVSSPNLLHQVSATFELIVDNRNGFLCASWLRMFCKITDQDIFRVPHTKRILMNVYTTEYVNSPAQRTVAFSFRRDTVANLASSIKEESHTGTDIQNTQHNGSGMVTALNYMPQERTILSFCRFVCGGVSVLQIDNLRVLSAAPWPPSFPMHLAIATATAPVYYII